MQLFYGGDAVTGVGGFALHSQGDLEISQSRQLEPADNPQREIITLKVKLDIFCAKYEEGYAKARAVIAALRYPGLNLLWKNEAETVPVTYLSQSAIPTATEEPESWGRTTRFSP